MKGFLIPPINSLVGGEEIPWKFLIYNIPIAFGKYFPSLNYFYGKDWNLTEPCGFQNCIETLLYLSQHLKTVTSWLDQIDWKKWELKSSPVANSKKYGAPFPTTH